MTDFKRTSYPQDGRGGLFPNVMGAYVTGSETVGPTSEGSSTQPPPPQVPNLRRTD